MLAYLYPRYRLALGRSNYFFKAFSVNALLANLIISIVDCQIICKKKFRTHSIRQVSKGVFLSTGIILIHSDEGLTLETSVFESYTVANLPYRPCG